MPGTFPVENDDAAPGIDWEADAKVIDSAEVYESNLLEEDAPEVGADSYVKVEPTTIGGRETPVDPQVIQTTLLQMVQLAQVLEEQRKQNQLMMDTMTSMVQRNEKLLEELSMRATAPHVTFS